MQKTKRNKFVVTCLMFAMIAMYGFIPVAKAATMTTAQDTISDSDVSATDVVHTIVFRPDVDITNGSQVSVTFHANIGNISSVNLACPSDATEGGAGQTVTCDVSSTLASTTDYTITLASTTNPGSAGSYDVTISHDEGDGASSEMLIYVIDDVTVSATVDASLTFGLSSVAADTAINGTATTTIEGSATTIPFSNLTVDKYEMIAQQLSVETNAAAGFSVTVQQDGNLTNAAGADIDSFANGTAVDIDSTTAWVSPTGTIAGGENGYGHMGITSTDPSLSTASFFDTDEYAGFNGTTPFEVMYHNGPADGTTAGAGLAQVGYRIEISSLQQAGDYNSTLTYVVTPTF